MLLEYSWWCKAQGVQKRKTRNSERQRPHTRLNGKISLQLVSVTSLVTLICIISAIEPKQNYLWGELVIMVEKTFMAMLTACMCLLQSGLTQHHTHFHLPLKTQPQIRENSDYDSQRPSYC